jgi:predicted lipoprotein
MPRTDRHALAACCALTCLLVSCVPWTVVPIEEEPQQNTTADPSVYVDSIWDSRLLPAVRENAVDLATARARYAEGQGRYFLIKGEGKVLSLDTTSRSGKLLIDAEPYDGTADVALLVGPVILGTALRDAAGFIEFTDFVNQLQFADVANELNQRVITDVAGPLDLPSLTGKRISFHGAWAASQAEIPEIVPVEVTVE